MNREDVDRIARHLMLERKGRLEREAGYIYHHGVRVAALAEALAVRVDEPLDVPADVLYAGAILHDVGKGLRPHAETGAAVVRDRLAAMADAATVEAVARIVGMHCRRGEPAGVAERLVQDADILDHFGAQQVWLNFHYSAAHDRDGHAALAYIRSAEHAAYAGGCRQALNFTAARAEFDRRRRFEAAFFARFADELAGRLASPTAGGTDDGGTASTAEKGSAS